MRITALSVVTCRLVLSEVLELARGTRTARGVLTLKPFLAWVSVAARLAVPTSKMHAICNDTCKRLLGREHSGYATMHPNHEVPW